MRNGLLVGFVAGFVFSLIVLNDQIGGLFTFVAAVAGGLVTFLVGLGTIGVVGLLVVLGFGLFIGSRWAERARARYDANRAWNTRANYRGGD